MTEQGQVGAEIARTPAGVDIARRNKDRFGAVLPQHIDAKSFVGLAEAAVYRNADLMRAAEESPRDFFDALVRCASLGHRPGTEEFYLVPFKDKGRQSVQGIEGYRGIVERMYRSGAVASIIVREVCENDDFEFVEGVQDRPRHRIDWFGSTRGAMIGVYAYAVMTTGAVSRVVILNKADIAATKERSRGSSSTHSPWQNDERSMWWKTAARRLEPWVPTSVEFFKERVRAASQAAALFDRPQATVQDASPLTSTEAGTVDTDTGEVVDAEVVQDSEPPPASPPPPSQPAQQPAAQPSQARPSQPVEDDGPPPFPKYFTTRTGRTEFAVAASGEPVIPPSFDGVVYVQDGDDRSTRREWRRYHADKAPAAQQTAPQPATSAADHEAAAAPPTAQNAGYCTCGMPEAPNVIHRIDRPCYLDPDAIQAEEAEVLEAEFADDPAQPELVAVGVVPPEPTEEPAQAPPEPQAEASTYTDESGVQWVRRGPRSQ
jgi:recombination protein RecT